MLIAKILRKIYVSFTFIVFYFYDLVLSATLIAWDVVTIKLLSNPGFVDVPLDAKSDLEIALIGNLITFSPGTMVVGLSEDRKSMRIHVMMLDDPQKTIADIKTKLESRVLEVLR